MSGAVAIETILDPYELPITTSVLAMDLCDWLCSTRYMPPTNSNQGTRSVAFPSECSHSARSTYQHVRRTSFIEADVDLDVRLSNSSPPCQVYSGVLMVDQSPSGIEVSTWLPSCSLGASCCSLARALCLSFSFSFGLEEKIPDLKVVRWFSLATAVGLLCDEYWTGCVDGRHIISSRTTSED